MKVIAKKMGALSIDPRTIVYFKAGEELSAGVKGLNEININRLIDLELVTVVDDTGEINEPNECYEFESINNKTELELFALEKYEIELDKKMSLKKMINKLKEIIEREV